MKKALVYKPIIVQMLGTTIQEAHAAHQDFDFIVMQSFGLGGFYISCKDTGDAKRLLQEKYFDPQSDHLVTYLSPTFAELLKTLQQAIPGSVRSEWFDLIPTHPKQPNTWLQTILLLISLCCEDMRDHFHRHDLRTCVNLLCAVNPQDEDERAEIAKTADQLKQTYPSDDVIIVYMSRLLNHFASQNSAKA